MKLPVFLFLWIAAAVSSPAQVRTIPPESSRRMPTAIDSLQRSQNENAAGPRDIIVEFSGEPMFVAQTKSPGNLTNSPVDSYASMFSRFASDVGAIGRLFPSSQSNPVAIRRQYLKIFFGVSVTVPSGMLPMISRLPYVKAVHFDREVHSMEEPVSGPSGAPAVRQTSGARADGVRVGIIDSGIDYLHPALGGGFGPGFKVAGGHDFVNDDDDPMDDNGHGTHVAGIVAADGDSVQGVAPFVTLYAYKALNAQGRGLESDIIEAVEWAVDPDRNGNFSDRLDVVNMSLGNDGGSPTDPTSIAVDNATGIGTVFCIAAGNAGGRTPVQGKENNYFYDGSATIGSPGTAELAVTVGASDTTSGLARFSSRGPNRVSFSIKPDVLAPGVGINSTYPASTYKVLSGTSMATPMIAGVAALVRSLHPSWTPAMVKSAIVNQAGDAGLGAYLQGGGIVRTAQSTDAKTLVLPSTLSYGLDDPAAATWTSPETLFVRNKHTAAQSYAVIIGGLQAGIFLNVSPSSFSIPPDDSIAVVVTLSVNNASVPVADEDILRFTGSVSFNGTLDTARVPWAFVRTNRLVITTSEPNAFFLGYSNASTILSISGAVSYTSPVRAEVYAPLKGTYEFFTVFRNPAGISRIVINEGVTINDDAADLFLDGAQAVHPLIFSGVDQQGSPLAAYRTPQRALMTSLPNFGNWVTTFTGGSDTVLLSTVANTHSFKPVEFQVDLRDSKTFHAIQFDRFTGMNGTRVATNSPSNYIREEFRVKVPPGTPSAVQATQVWSYTDVNGTGGFGGIGLAAETVAVAGDEYAFTGYFGKSSIPSEDLAVKFLTNYADLGNPTVDYDGPFIMPYKDSIVATPREFVTPAIPRFESGATMTFGGSPASLMVLWYNNTFGPNTLHFQTVFRGMLGENRNNDALAGTYTVFDKNGAELFTRSLGEPRQPLELTADVYRVAITSSNYWLRGTRGTVTLSSTMNLGNGLPANPPSVTSFMVLDSLGHPTDHFAINEPAKLRFAVNVVNFSNNVLPLPDSTKAWYRTHGTTAWLPLVLSTVAAVVGNEGLILDADLGAATTEDSVAVDLRISSRDSAGFTVDQIVAPVFAVGNWNPVVTSVPPEEGTPKRFALEQNYPNPFNPATTIRYQTASSDRVTLKVYDLLGREVATLVSEYQEAGSHSSVWDASDASSGVYVCRLQAGSNVGTTKLLLLK
jgi:hypothetical protein